jgi:hypothetical protein
VALLERLTRLDPEARSIFVRSGGVVALQHLLEEEASEAAPPASATILIRQQQQQQHGEAAEAVQAEEKMVGLAMRTLVTVVAAGGNSHGSGSGSGIVRWMLDMALLKRDGTGQEQDGERLWAVKSAAFQALDSIWHNVPEMHREILPRMDALRSALVACFLAPASPGAAASPVREHARFMALFFLLRLVHDDPSQAKALVEMEAQGDARLGVALAALWTAADGDEDAKTAAKTLCLRLGASGGDGEDLVAEALVGAVERWAEQSEGRELPPAPLTDALQTWTQLHTADSLRAAHIQRTIDRLRDTQQPDAADALAAILSHRP